MNSKKDILLIDADDDELVNFDLAMSDLQINYICRHARTSESALKILHVTVPGVIFLDINMPKENGLDCLKQIRQIKNMQDVPVVMYCTYMDDKTCNKSLKRGAAACADLKLQVIS